MRSLVRITERDPSHAAVRPRTAASVSRCTLYIFYVLYYFLLKNERKARELTCMDLSPQALLLVLALIVVSRGAPELSFHLNQTAKQQVCVENQEYLHNGFCCQNCEAGEHDVYHKNRSRGETKARAGLKRAVQSPPLPNKSG